MEKNTKVTEILLKALRLSLRFLLVMVVLFVLVAGSLQIPGVQTRAAKILTDYLSDNTGFRTDIQSVNIRWWDALSLGNVRIYDLEDSLMVNLEEVYIDFSISGLMDKESPGFDEIVLKRGLVRIMTHSHSDAPNISTFLARLTELARPSDPLRERRPVRFNIDHISLHETSLDILNYKMETLEQGFDYGKLRFRELVADADDFYIRADTVGFDLKFMTGIESTSGMVFQQLRTDFIYSNRGMEFNDLYLKSNDTEIKNYLRFTYDDVSALNDFNDQVTVFASLDEAVLDIRDLKYFSRSFPDIDDRIYLSGDISGRVSELFSDQLLIRFGERSALFGTFNIQGLPEIDSTYFNLSLMNSTLTSQDLVPYITAEARREVNKFREFRFNADFAGYLKNFSTNGSFRTGIGRISGNLNYNSTKGRPAYNGRIALANLDLGVIMEDKEMFQKASLKGQVRGTGLTVETILLELQADVESIGINHYPYTGIKTNATFGKDLFNGKLAIDDPNLKMTLDGSLDLRNGKDSARLVAKLDTAFLRELNLMEKESFLSGDFELDTKGITLDDIEGVARFRDVLVSYEGRDLFVDNFIFQSLFTDESRLISLNSDLLVAGISGNFKMEEVGRDLKRLWQEYYAIVTNAEVKQEGIYPGELNEYSIDLNIDFRDPNPIINLIDPALSISKNTQLEGAFYRTGENTILNFFSSIDTINYRDHYFLENNIDFNTSKIHNSKEVLAAFYVFSKNQQLKPGITFHDFSLEAIWDESAVELAMGLDQLQTGSYARINSTIGIAEDSTTIVFGPSDIKLLDKFWKFEKNNRITVTQGGDVSVNNLMIYNQNQFLSANGHINRNPEEFLYIEINELNMDFLNALDLREFKGTANGLFALNGFYDQKGSTGGLNIRDLYINNFLIGDIEATTAFASGSPNLHLTNFREGKKIIEVEGSLGSDIETMGMTARLNEANLSVLEPFLSRYITGLGGTISGDFKLEGSLVQPQVIGTGKVSGGTLRINYLNTFYTVNGNVTFVPNQISFKDLSLKDVQGHTATFRGGITHEYFSNFVLNVSSDLNNFQVLNTTLAHNKLFYGTAFASGELDILGAANNIELTARATTQPNTRIYIPLATSNGQFQEEFINFINVHDTTRHLALEEPVGKPSINNFRMNFDLNVTPDAYAEIQIDPRTGENIQGRGKGVLNLGIDSEGNFSMTGNYEIVDALYDFSLYNVINKRFVIEPGGRISWFGDPYEGVMNIQAAYVENVSLISLQDNTATTEENSQMKRKYPLRIIMDLNGPLLSPDIAFDFDFSNFPEGELQIPISAFKNRIANDEQEKNRQVFSLIMLRRFSPAGQFSGAGIGFSNLSQLVSSQLNSLISQVDQNLEIDFDLASLDETAMESFQLRVAYTFFEGRLRVMRDGGFTDFQGNTDLNSIAGDWQAEYLLTEDGRYVIRVYNRTNFNNSLNPLYLRNPNTYGISLSQTLLFSSFRELFQRTNRRDRMRDIEPVEIILDDMEERIFSAPANFEELMQNNDAPPINIYDHPKDLRKDD